MSNFKEGDVLRVTSLWLNDTWAPSIRHVGATAVCAGIDPLVMWVDFERWRFTSDYHFELADGPW